MTRMLKWTGKNLEKMREFTAGNDGVGGKFDRFRLRNPQSLEAEVLSGSLWVPVPVGRMVKEVAPDCFIAWEPSPTPLRPEDFPTGHEFVCADPPEPIVETRNRVNHTTWPPAPCDECDLTRAEHVKISAVPPQTRAIVDRLMEAAGATVKTRQALNDHLDTFVTRQIHAWLNAEAEGAVLIGDMVAVQVRECTCSGGDYGYPHEPYCGLEPFFKIGTRRHDADVIRRASERFSGSETRSLLELANQIENGAVEL